MSESELLLTAARFDMREAVRMKRPYNPYEGMNEQQENLIRFALEKENPEATTPGYDPLHILVHEYQNLLRQSRGEAEIPLDIMSLPPVPTPWRKEYASRKCVLTGTNRCPCTPGGPEGCYPSPSPSPTVPLGDVGGGGRS